MQFSPDQIKALDLMDRGTSIFLTGGAGTGKTELIKEFIRRHPNKKIVRLATTGAAAQLIGGQTMHSFFDLGREIHRPDNLRMTTKMRMKIQAATCFIIEEISMARIDHFQGIRDRLFGAAKGYGNVAGYQLIAVGDFAQLPPVLSQGEAEAVEALYGKGNHYAFQSRHWGMLQEVELDRVHRQAGDAEFAEWLGSMRRCEPIDLGYINQRVAKPASDSTFLVASNRACETINQREMAALPGGHYRIPGEVKNTFHDYNMRVPPTLLLKPGARVVICANNLKAGYSNGSTGTLIKCDRIKGQPIANVRLDSGAEVVVTQAVWENVSYLVTPDGIQRMSNGDYRQLPLLPGWAITIHRSQGMSIDRLHVDAEGVFAHGQAYVALSRATSLKGLTLSAPIKAEHIIVDPRVRAYMATARGDDARVCA